MSLKVASGIATRMVYVIMVYANAIHFMRVSFVRIENAKIIAHLMENVWIILNACVIWGLVERIVQKICARTHARKMENVRKKVAPVIRDSPVKIAH